MEIDNIVLSKALSLAHVPRWCIVDTIKNQSVAEHSYNVTVIAMAIYDQIRLYINETGNLKINILEKALLHDIKESITGDIPSPMKCRDEVLDCSLGDAIVHVSDYIEAIIFIDRYGINVSIVRNYVNDKLQYWITVLLGILDAGLPPLLKKAIRQNLNDITLIKRIYESDYYARQVEAIK